MTHFRKSDYSIHPLILHRWSPRAMSGEPLSEETLFSLFEAARWAPSSANNQPWHFLYARKDAPHFSQFLDLLVPANQVWAKQAAVLGVILALKVFESTGKPSVTHALDTGAAWENLCLEGSHQGLVVHGMEGFDYKRARSDLRVPENYEILAMFAIGRPGKLSDLPEPLQKREQPSGRKPLNSFISEGIFKKN